MVDLQQQEHPVVKHHSKLVLVVEFELDYRGLYSLDGLEAAEPRVIQVRDHLELVVLDPDAHKSGIGVELHDFPYPFFVYNVDEELLAPVVLDLENRLCSRIVGETGPHRFGVLYVVEVTGLGLEGVAYMT